MSSDVSLTRTEARAIAVTAQRLDTVSSPRDFAETMGALGCIQIDAMQAVRRSHELALLARNVASTPPADKRATFETWGHAHSLVAMQLWPHLQWRRRRIRENGLSGPEVDPAAVARVMDSIRAHGPMTLPQLESARGSGWDRQSPSRWACEWLLSVGDLAVVERNEKWQRIYSLPENVIPEEYLHQDLSDEDCLRAIVDSSLTALGVATAKDVADYFRIDLKATTRILNDSTSPTATVEGSADVWYLAPHAAPATAGCVELLPLSPLDALVWTRERQRALFEKSYLLESYKPASKREFGYFGMPLLLGTDLIGRIAARRSGVELKIEALQTDFPLAADDLNRLFALLAEWSGCAQVSITGMRWIAS